MITDSGYQPPATQEDLDRIITARLKRERKNADAEQAAAREWEARFKEMQQDADTWRRESQRWERLAKQNLAVIHAHEATIQRFIDKLDDVLTEEQ